MNSISLIPSITNQHVLHEVKATEKVCNRFKALVVAGCALQKVVEATKKGPARLACASGATITGIVRTFSGDVVFGPLMAVAGAKEVYNLFSAKESDLKRLLEDVNASREMLGMIQEFNDNSYNVLDCNLTTIDQHITKLEKALEDVNLIASKGSKEVEAQKKKAISLNKQAIELFKKAEDAFDNSQGKIRNGSDRFNKALKKFSNLFEIAQNDKGDLKDRLKQFVTLAQEIYQECEKGKKSVDNGDDVLGKGIDLLKDAMGKYADAFLETGRALEISSSYLKDIEQRTKSDSEIFALKEQSRNAIQESKEEISALRRRSNDTVRILDAMHQDLEEAKELANQNVSWASVIFGGIPGAVLGSSAGPMGLAAGMIAGTAFAENPKPIYNAALKVKNFVTGTVEEKESVKVLTKPVSFAHDKRSSGWWGRYVANRASQTVGTLDLKIGDQTLAIRYNLNSRDEKISKFDLVRIAKTLKQQISKGKLDPKQALGIIHELQTVVINRGTKGISQGFIPTNSPYLNAIEDMCKDPEMLAHYCPQAQA